MEGDGAGCLSCMTGCNGSFFQFFSLVCTKERVRLQRTEKSPHPSTPHLSFLWRWVEGGGTCLDQMLCPVVESCFFEAV